ncbi:uncharacterized protein N7479_004062 [Penicillium vulpinum]|uniref:Uncharacterized protein n=1 Tax=Penicillium vulpinum TaxID=29845 RepID=A0A1V6SBU5_9EURO|nr:uncharacterized protein N7479_004062 [Penicillium vulpinum]KAJ5964186.1 hypothetical protein N7479_004062 [Penicillium vulpinum]OQE11462.1 hypothetical protein PENVUL_c002G08571 [Penicillium vulpinum]
MPSIARRLFRGARAIQKYRTERDILVRNIRSYIATLRQLPEGNYLVEIALNVHSLKVQADKVKWASQALTTDAGDMNYVASQGFNHFFFAIPAVCDQIGRDTRQMSETLFDHIHTPNEGTEHRIALYLERSLANLGFV